MSKVDTNNQYIENIRKASELGVILRQIVVDKKLSQEVRRGAPHHILVEAWQILGEIVGVHPVVTAVTPVDGGYEAQVDLVNKDGLCVGRGFSMCTRKEKMWANRDDFAIHAMAQTRATGRAFRNRYGQIAKLAGYSATPYEEMIALKESKVEDEVQEVQVKVNDLTKVQREKLGRIYKASAAYGDAAQVLRLKDAGIECENPIDGFKQVNKSNFKKVVESFNNDKTTEEA